MDRQRFGFHVFCVMLLAGGLSVSIARAAQPADLKELALRATGQAENTARQARAELRAAGPAGLAALIDANAGLVERHRRGEASAAAEEAAWPRVAAAIDAVAAQKDAWASGLYWYTDIEAAKRAARESGRPILSLRLLGTLDSEYSCANSRFFRTVLYANADVSREMSGHFILHWKSVRPVPKVTIDFGDGRVVQRTITGNSIHYVLTSDGRVIDGIPGLYGPKAFLQELIDATTMATLARDASNPAPALREWHLTQNNRILARWENDLRQVGVLSTEASLTLPPREPVTAPKAKPKANPTAVQAVPTAVGKAVVERRLVVALAPDPTVMQAAKDVEIWATVAALHADDAKLDTGSRALMAAKNPTARQAGRVAVSKLKVENPLVRIVQNFERSIAEDTVRNEYTFHRQIHLWLAGATPSMDLDAFNDRVYAELFLTPSSDPWLGLLPPNTYSALPDDGLCRAK
jgi:hypothetical protein